MQDDERQSPIATRLIESLSLDEPGFVSLIALVETTWVLARAYGLTRGQVAAVVEGLLRSRELVVDEGADVLQALRSYDEGAADFADCLIQRRAARVGCTRTITFDRRAAKTAGMELLDS